MIGLHTSTLFATSRAMVRRLGWLRAPEYDFHPVPQLHAEAYVLAL